MQPTTAYCIQWLDSHWDIAMKVFGCWVCSLVMPTPFAVNEDSKSPTFPLATLQFMSARTVWKPSTESMLESPYEEHGENHNIMGQTN